jgi:hypothetical protein
MIFFCLKKVKGTLTTDVWYYLYKQYGKTTEDREQSR